LGGARVLCGGFYSCLTRPRSHSSRSDESFGREGFAPAFSPAIEPMANGASAVRPDSWRKACRVDCIGSSVFDALQASSRREAVDLPPIRLRGRSPPSLPTCSTQLRSARSNLKWILTSLMVWTAEGWLYVSSVVDLFFLPPRGCWSMTQAMNGPSRLRPLVWRSGDEGKPTAALHPFPIAAAIHQRAVHG